MIQVNSPFNATGQITLEMPDMPGPTPTPTISDYYVRPEMWGAIPDGMTDCTKAFESALAQKKPVFLGAGTYLLDYAVMSNVGQLMQGSGVDITTLKKRSGNAPLVSMPSANYTSLRDLTLNGNNLDAPSLHAARAYCSAHNVVFRDHGGYAMKLDGANSCFFSHLIFATRNYSSLYMKDSLYNMFYSCNCGTPLGPVPTIVFDNTQLGIFYGLTTEPGQRGCAIKMINGSHGNAVYGYRVEYDNALQDLDPLVWVDGSVMNTEFSHIYIYNNTDSRTKPYFLLEGVGITLDGFFFRKPTSNAEAIILLNGARRVAINNVIDCCASPHTFIQANEAIHVRLTNAHHHIEAGSGKPTCVWNGSMHISVSNSNMKQRFDTAPSYYITMDNVSTEINKKWANFLQTTNCPEIVE